MNKKNVLVVGAGIVGVTTALELQKRGSQVVLLDRKQPGMETSYGNAGVLSHASITTVNNPSIIRSLPRLLLRHSAGLRYDLTFILSRLPWFLRFLSYSGKSHMRHAGSALYELLNLSVELHSSLAKESGVDTQFNNGGWLKGFRTARGFRSAQMELEFLRQMGVNISTYSADETQQLEPSFRPVFHQSVLLENIGTVSPPLDLTQAYVKLFKRAGGKIRMADVISINLRSANQWSVQTGSSEMISAEQLVIAAGPWSDHLAKTLGYSIPMAWERGYHMHLESATTARLKRPVHDVECGYVMSPQPDKVRILTGVEFTHRDSPPNYTQIQQAVASARTVADFGRELDEQPWMGSRPTLPDSLPMLGAAPRHTGLWFNFGHQHIGMSASAGCARVLVDLMEGKSPLIDSMPFSPKRFRL